MTIDLSEVVNPGKTYDVEIVHPATRAPIGATITVVGIDSEQYRNCLHSQRNKRMRNIKPGRINTTADEMEQDAVELLAASTVGWEGVVYKGAELPFSKKAAAELYASQPWLREQIDEAVGNRENFS